VSNLKLRNVAFWSIETPLSASLERLPSWATPTLKPHREARIEKNGKLQVREAACMSRKLHRIKAKEASGKCGGQDKRLHPCCLSH
jgi:hypothetical protein